jgi:hypothetical protein
MFAQYEELRGPCLIEAAADELIAADFYVRIV